MSLVNAISWQRLCVYTFRDSSLGGPNISTACSREVAVRGGHPLGLIEYVIERVYQVFLPFELHKFGICINPKECPPLTFHQPKDLNRVPSSHFHQPKGF